MTIKAINVRNQFKGVIKEILIGEVVSEIDVQTASGIVTSVITTRSVRDLELKVGSEVIAFVKSTEVVNPIQMWERACSRRRCDSRHLQ
jgi:molybdopterin-binding protein